MKLRGLIAFSFLAIAACKGAPASNHQDASVESTAAAVEIPENVLDYVRDANGNPVLDENGRIQPTLINGEEVNIADWAFTVRITTGSSGCSATAVGPKVVVTAAHCGITGASSKFTVNGKEYTGKVERSSLYPARDHDVSVIILDAPLPKADVKNFASIGGSPANGQDVYLCGYGCTQAGGGGGNDGKLRCGMSKITGAAGFDIISSNGAALCFGDSGGPMFTTNDNTKPVLLGVNSKGNIRDTNYNASTVSNESRAFWTAMASKYSVEICGVNGTDAVCGGGTPPPPPPPPPPPGDCDALAQKQLLLGVAACFGIPIAIPTFD